MSRPLHDRLLDPEPFTFTAHPPERRRRSSVIAAQACCCCCCCCCLHSIGGLVGALVGSLLHVAPTPREMDPDAEFPFRRDEELPTFVVPASLVYWALFSLASALTWGGFVLAYASPTPTGDLMIGAGIGVIMLLPVVQLVASIIAALTVFVLPRSICPDRNAAIVRVGLITLWSFVGTMVGILIMFLPLIPALFMR